MAFSLTSEQQAAVDNRGGGLLVSAAAGSGKTRVLVERLLARVEGAEDALFRLGYTDFRVRVFHGAARLQLPAGQLERAVRERAVLRAALAPYFKPILLDLEER